MLLDTTQLFDLLKAKRPATQTGKRGGRFYISEGGKRVYVGQEKLSGTPAEATPHTSGDTTSKVQGVEVTPLSAGPESRTMQGQMKVSPPKGFINRETSRAHIQQAQQNWPSYFCRVCNAAIVPKHNEPLTTRDWGTHDVPPAETKVVPVPKEGGGVEHAVREVHRKVGETTKVTVVKPSGERSTHYGWKPEWLATKLCPDDYDAEAAAAKRELGEAKETQSAIHAFMTHTRQMSAKRKKTEKEERRIHREAKGEREGRARVEEARAKVAVELEQRKKRAKEQKVVEGKKKVKAARMKKSVTLWVSL